jgi:hypothetical protein
VVVMSGPYYMKCFVSDDCRMNSIACKREHQHLVAML